MRKILLIADISIMKHNAKFEGDVVLLNSVDLNGKAPDEIQLIPFGVHNTLKYGKIVVDDESLNSIMAFRKTREPNDELIDYEHQSFAEPPQEAPASGWIKKLINKGKDGIWAAVEWTDKARSRIEAKEYRYFSPVTITRKTDGVVLGLLGGGLTNLPNIIGIKPLTNKASIQTHKEGQSMKALAALLGLPETATEDEIMAAVKKLIETASGGGAAVAANRAVTAALGLAEGAGQSELVGTVMAMKQTHSQFEALQTETLRLRTENAERTATELVTNAMKPDDKGMVKILPAQKDWATAYAKKDPEGFGVYVNKTPGTLLTGSVAGADKGGGAQQLDETVMQVCKAFGNDPEAVKKHLVAA